MLNDEDKVLINSIKGRLSKVLNNKIKLLKIERSTLESLYYTIEKFSLNDDEFKNIDIFKDTISNSLLLLENSKRAYIKEHVIPLINRVLNRSWGKCDNE